jgi:glucans biosynthesis protein C
MGTIFLFHSSRPFVIFPSWHVMNSTPDLGFTLFDTFVSGWIMPLFFAISGIAAYSSLSRRSVSQFVRDRFERLIIPFTFGVFFILPVNVYYDAAFHGAFTGGFLQFYRAPFFAKFFPFDLDFSPTYFADSNQGVYLWYLFWLFAFSLITVHLFKWLTQDGIRGKLSRLYGACERRGGLLLLAIPLIAVNIVAVPPFFVFPSGYGGWKLPTYLVLFIASYLMASSPRFEESIQKSRMLALLLGILTSLSMLALLVILLSDPHAMERYYLLVSTVWALNGWCWVTAIIGFGRKYLSFDHRYLKPANELVLPFYVLHQSVIVAIASYVVGLDLIVVEKYVLVVLVSFPIIAALLYPISRVNLLRFLFGMRLKNRSH